MGDWKDDGFVLDDLTGFSSFSIDDMNMIDSFSYQESMCIVYLVIFIYVLCSF